jgi:hypothetical protein
VQLSLVKSYKLNQKIFYIFIFCLTVVVNIVLDTGVTVSLPDAVVGISKILLLLLTLSVFIYSTYFRFRTKFIYDYYDIFILLNFVFLVSIFIIKELFYGVKVDHVLLFVITIYLFRIFLVTIEDFKKFIFVLFIASLFHILNNILQYIGYIGYIGGTDVIMYKSGNFSRAIGLTTGPLGASAFFVMLNMLFYTFIYYFKPKLKIYFILFFVLTLVLANGRASILILVIYFMILYFINLGNTINLNIFFIKFFKISALLIVIILTAVWLYDGYRVPFLINLVLSFQDFEKYTSGPVKLHTYYLYYGEIFSNLDIFMHGQMDKELFDFSTESVFIGFLLSYGVIPILSLYLLFIYIIFRGFKNSLKFNKMISAGVFLSLCLVFITNGAFSYPTCIIIYTILGYILNQTNMSAVKNYITPQQIKTTI